MDNFNFKKLTPHIVAVMVFIAISLVYFSPLLKGKKLKQNDIIHFKGMSKEIVDFRERTGEEPLWTGTMFCGMPAYQISVNYKSNLVQYLDKIFKLWLPHPASALFLYLIGFYILLLCLRVNPWISLAGAIAFAFSSYFFIVIEAGHNSKAHAIAYMAPTLAGVILAFRGKYLLGGIVFALFMALQLKANHFQITYYLVLLLFIYAMVKFVLAVKEKTIMQFIRASGVLVIGGALALGTSASVLLSTLEYGKYSTRGKSELTFKKEDQTSGLERSYVTQWSYGIGESWTLLVPDYKGGASGQIGIDAPGIDKLDARTRGVVAQLDPYFGDQPFTSGPVYAGAIVCFLFVLGMFYVQGALRWALLAATILSIMLSWGKHYMDLTNFFLDYIPGYNKFRAVSMILVIAELALPILAVMVIQKVYDNAAIIREKKNQFFIAFALTGGLALAFYIAPDMFNEYLKAGEPQSVSDQLKQAGLPEAQIPPVIAGMEEVRKNVFRADAIRSFIFILLAGAVLWLYSRKVLNQKLFIAAIGVLFLADMWPVNKRYLNKENFVPKIQILNPHQPNRADQQILADKETSFRVYNTTVRPDQDSRTSYFHKSLGGYHGAKMRRYQELLDFHINRRNFRVINMLNPRYIIVKGQDGLPEARLNPEALGNAWFVKEYELVANADSEITALSNFDPARTLIVDQRYQDQLKDFVLAWDSTASIKLTQYEPNHLVYETSSSREQLAVFSEIFYDKGWNAYVDDELKPHFRGNYVLRSMRIPAGSHTIEFKFEPTVYSRGETISLISSALLLLLLAAAGWKEYQKRAAA